MFAENGYSCNVSLEYLLTWWWYRFPKAHIVSMAVTLFSKCFPGGYEVKVLKSTNYFFSKAFRYMSQQTLPPAPPPLLCLVCIISSLHRCCARRAVDIHFSFPGANFDWAFHHSRPPHLSPLQPLRNANGLPQSEVGLVSGVAKAKAACSLFYSPRSKEEPQAKSLLSPPANSSAAQVTSTFAIEGVMTNKNCKLLL